MKFLDKVDNLKSKYKENEKSKICRVSNTLKKRSNTLRCFCNLQFQNSSFSNKLFSCIFYSKRIFYTAQKNQIKYFVQNLLIKTIFFCVQTAA